VTLRQVEGGIQGRVGAQRLCVTVGMRVLLLPVRVTVRMHVARVLSVLRLLRVVGEPLSGG
jgi:hypothetical protein